MPLKINAMRGEKMLFTWKRKVKNKLPKNKTN
jgi:hypothetical protein